jgi:hypothetical protein
MNMAFRLIGGTLWFPLAMVLPVALLAFSELTAAEPKTGPLWVYVGTYTQRGSKGIYRFDFDSASGKLTSRALAAEAKNPSFVAIDPDQRFLYAVSEVDNIDGKNSGAVSAFAIDRRTGDLTVAAASRFCRSPPTAGSGSLPLSSSTQGLDPIRSGKRGRMPIPSISMPPIALPSWPTLDWTRSLSIASIR